MNVSFLIIGTCQPQTQCPKWNIGRSKGLFSDNPSISLSSHVFSLGIGKYHFGIFFRGVKKVNSGLTVPQSSHHLKVRILAWFKLLHLFHLHLLIVSLQVLGSCLEPAEQRASICIRGVDE